MVHLARLLVVILLATMAHAVIGAEPKEAPAADAKPAPATLTKTQKELFAWFDKLGYPAVEKQAFVRTRDFFKSGEEEDGKVKWEVREYLAFGFLAGEDLHAKPQTFTVLTADAVFHGYKPTRLGAPEAERVFHQPADLRDYAKEMLEQSRDPEKFSEVFEKSLQSSGTRQTISYLAFTAWWRHRCGHDDLAAQLMERARTYTFGEEADDAGVMAMVREDFAGHHYDNILRLMAEEESSRAEMVRAVEKLIELMPDNPEDRIFARPVEKARRMLPVLRHMAEEDRRYEGHEDEIARDEIKMHVYFLRDQPGASFSNPGRCDIWGDDVLGGNWFGTRYNPAREIYKHDLKAIPALIEALTDDRFSRAIEDTKGPGYILRIGDCAIQIIERIAGRSFCDRADMVDERLAPDVKEKVRAWWKELQEKGEPRMLGDVVAAGTDDALASAERLVERYPGEAAPFLGRGIAAAKDDYTREKLITMAWNAGFDDALRTELFKLMKESKNAAVRARAAWGLFLQGGEDERKVVDALKQTWPPFADRDGPWPAQRTALILSLSGRADAADALDMALAAAGGEVRGEVLRILDVSYVPQLIVDRVDMKPFSRKPKDADQQRAMERLIAEHLKDAVRSSVYVRSTGATIGELAAAALAARWPKVYSFDFAATPEERETQRLACLKTWEKRRGDAGR